MKNSNSPAGGYHLIAELHGCPKELLEKADKLKEILMGAAKDAGFDIVNDAFYQFEPSGATGVVVLSASHISAHTWPEFNYVALDIYSCGGADKAKKALDLCLKRFKSKKYELKEVLRFR